MHEHDMDLIMALAEGTLGESSAAAAEQEIAQCVSCREDLALQRQALEAMSGAPRVYLTATESARLRSRVRSELGLTPVAPAKAAERRPRRFTLGALAGAAAVLLAVVVAGPALDLLGSSSDDGAATPDAVALPSPASAEIDPEADRLTEESVSGPLPAADPAPSSGDMASALAPSPRLVLENEADLERLKTSLIDQARAGGTSLLSPAELFAAGEPNPGDAADPAEDAPGSPAQIPDADPAVPPPAAAQAPAPDCADDAAAAIDQGEATTVVEPILYQGSDALLFAFIADPVEDSRLVVVDAATCEVLAEA